MNNKMKTKVLLTAIHGRPSTKLAFSTMVSDSSLIQRRQLPRRTYYRVFEDRVALAEHIKQERKYLYEYKKQEVDLADSVVVRWGTREALNTNERTVIYNKASAIKDATDKKKSREMFIHSRVKCPALVTPENFKDEYLPIIARPFVHSKGKNFIVLETKEDFLNHYKDGWYYSNFIDKKQEFRVHVAHGKVLALMEKPKPNNNNMAWNRAQNDVDPFHYVKWDDIDSRNLKHVLVQGIKAVNALGLDFGGVDVIEKDGEAYVLEVNTAPTLNSSPYVAKRWGQYFDWLFRKNHRRAHWGKEILRKDYGKSMVWKNFQLLENVVNDG